MCVERLATHRDSDRIEAGIILAGSVPGAAVDGQTLVLEAAPLRERALVGDGRDNAARGLEIRPQLEVRLGFVLVHSGLVHVRLVEEESRVARSDDIKAPGHRSRRSM